MIEKAFGLIQLQPLCVWTTEFLSSFLTDEVGSKKGRSRKISAFEIRKVMCQTTIKRLKKMKDVVEAPGKSLYQLDRQS